MLLLLPNSLRDEISSFDYAASLQEEIASIDGLIAESEKRGRQFLKAFTYTKGRSFRDIPIRLLNEHTNAFHELLDPLLKGETWGLISDQGLPCLADPGSKIVTLAHKHQIHVKAFPGPSSMVLALMLSGFPAQSFTFHGYFPLEKERLKKQIKQNLLQKNHPHLFIETPYRSESRLKDLLELLPQEAHLSIAWDLTLPTQGILTHSIRDFRKIAFPDLKKRPCIFNYIIFSAT